jgi:phosphoribosylformylglycinamidine synthase
MRVGVVTFPGTTDDSDIVNAVLAVGGEPVILHDADATLGGIDAVVLPGGASFGDFLRPGALARFTPVVDAIVQRARDGMPVLGIGNGFQVLCESRLLPGALTSHAGDGYLSLEQRLRDATRDTVWTNTFAAGEEVMMALTCGAGRYIATPEVLEQLEASDQIVFRYVGTNPTGSAHDIAGITNERGTVVGLMAHPEYSADEADSSVDGRRFFSSLGVFLDVVSTPR